MSLFARLYLMILLILTLTSVAVLATLDQTNRHRFDGFADRHATALQVVASANWNALASPNPDDWLAVLTRLTGAAWHQSDNPPARSRWWATDADLELRLGEQSVTARIEDWDDLLVGTGYLLLNAVSLVAPEARDRRLNELASAAGLPARRIEIAEAELDFLQQRQLQQGQAIVLRDTNQSRTAILPAAGGHALRLGPVPAFAWLSPLALVGLTVATFAGLGLVLYLALRPFRQRLERIVDSAGAIEADPSALTLPEQPADELGRMCHHLNRMAARLVDHARRNRELNQAVSHDLKTPLAQFKFGLALLEADQDGTSTRIEQLQASVGRMERLIDELLLFHRLEDRAEPGGDTQTDVARLLGELLDAIEPPAGIELESQWQDTLPPLPGERRLLERLFDNLIGNALRHAGGHVRVTATTGRQETTFLVDDDGPGVPADQLERVFEPFVRLDPARGDAQAGSGLGLAICRRIATGLGGRVWLETSPLGGCRAVLKLPHRSLTLPDKA